MNQLSLSEQLTFSTVRIESELNDGSHACGTGFFFRFAITQETPTTPETYLPCIITNKHVLNGAKNIVFHLTLKDKDQNPMLASHVTIELDESVISRVDHPDPDVDLTLIPVGPFLFPEGNLFTIYLNDDLIPTQAELSDLRAIEDIIMIGYPTGIWDSVNNKPLIRKGITATHPAIPYNGKSEFVIDMACFPGSSGSPVFLYNEGSYQDRSGTNIAATRIKLLGVLYAGPMYTAEGEIRVVNVPTKQVPVASSAIPMNLGFVISSQRVSELGKIAVSRFENGLRLPYAPYAPLTATVMCGGNSIGKINT